MSSNSNDNKKRGGGQSVDHEPRIKIISPMAGQTYIASAQNYCLKHLSIYYAKNIRNQIYRIINIWYFYGLILMYYI